MAPLLYLTAYFPYYIAKHFKVKISYIIAGMFTVGLYFLLFTEGGMFILEIISKKQHEFFQLAYSTQAGSSLYLPSLSTDNPLTFIKAIPYAFYNVIILPLPWRINKIVYVPYVVENLFFFGIWLFIFLKAKKIIKKDIPFAWTLILFILSYGLLIGLTTPVLGAIVRYKAILTPMILALIIYMVNPNTLPPKLKKLWITK